MKYYMNIMTGSVDTEMNWTAEHGTEVLKCLTEVMYGVDGWCEITEENIIDYLVEMIKDYAAHITTTDAVILYSGACGLREYITEDIAQLVLDAIK